MAGKSVGIDWGELRIVWGDETTEAELKAAVKKVLEETAKNGPQEREDALVKVSLDLLDSAFYPEEFDLEEIEKSNSIERAATYLFLRWEECVAEGVETTGAESRIASFLDKWEEDYEYYKCAMFLTGHFVRMGTLPSVVSEWLDTLLERLGSNSGLNPPPRVQGDRGKPPWVFAIRARHLDLANRTLFRFGIIPQHVRFRAIGKFVPGELAHTRVGDLIKEFRKSVPSRRGGVAIGE